MGFFVRFDWLRFCTRYHIPYVTSGPNTAKGNISIRCVFCGGADPSQHLGLSLDVHRPYWGCLRNREHRGRLPTKLVSALLHLPTREAEDLVAKEAPPVEDFDETLDNLRKEVVTEPQNKPPEVLHLPPEFRSLSLATGARNAYAGAFLDYLASRRLIPPQAVAEHYGLWYALTGEQAWRLVFPIWNTSGGLVGWTGRDIRQGARLRYRTQQNMGKSVLLTFPRSRRQRTMVVCEGPFDALKIDWYGKALGLFAVATLGAVTTAEQIAALRALIADGSGGWVLFDADAIAQGLSLSEELGIRFRPTPPGYKDVGEMTRKDVILLCQELAAK